VEQWLAGQWAKVLAGHPLGMVTHGHEGNNIWIFHTRISFFLPLLIDGLDRRL
jgi:hypothetical protein